MAPRPSYRLDPETRDFVVEHYNWAPPFSNFFPGIAGLWGIPTWIYYVNRGQAVCSLGVRDKDGQILEFQSFNQACARVALEGFRTFLRLDGRASYEPFRKTAQRGVEQTLIMSASELRLVERNRPLGLEIEVSYFPLVNVRVAALVRQITIRDTAERGARRLEWIDGAPRVLPFGLDQRTIKGIPRHIEGMMGVVDHRGIPVFRLKQTAADSERVGEITGGNFYLANGARLGDGVVVDPEAVFGAALEYDRPWRFDDGGARAVLRAPQYRDNKTPSAFTVRTDRLGAGGSVELTSLLGYVRHDDELAALARRVAGSRFVAAKRAENTRVIDEIADHAFTVSASPAFDAYARQDFLDNVIRGGMPLVFDTKRGASAFYVYSRQNGDLERDYHHFVLEPTYLSQGTGHYRSVLQNRRTDTWFFPEVDDANLRTFLGLVQLDAYNPLEVRESSYRVVDRRGAERWLRGLVRAGGRRRDLLAWMERGFTPGELVMRLEDAGARPKDGWLAALAGAFACSRENEVGGLHEGFWADHWHYNFDLLDVYAMVYPDRLDTLLLGTSAYSYFDDPDVIVPRSQRLVDAGGKIRAYGAVVRDPEKVAMIAKRPVDAYRARTRHGRGAVLRTPLLVKLLTILVNRVATLDAGGRGLEMEGGKPGWNDSMNGLPGLLGSGLSELIELSRAVRQVDDLCARLPPATKVPVFAELARFMRALRAPMATRTRSNSAGAAMRYWDQANTLKERYRAATRLGVAGATSAISVTELRAFLRAADALLAASLDGPARARVCSRDGVPYTYFINEVTSSRPTGKRSHLGLPTVTPRAIRARPVKLFLEGPVHWMKARPAEARAVYDAVRRSALHDPKLGMYKACEPMTGETPELGRAVGAYPRGWIENESIYLHMEYKYLLEILRSGLCDEFWRDAKTALMPFLDPATYGRSTLEGASFIVSSAYADPRLHGRAFQPRLSGITCEFLHIWILAVAGERPFQVDARGRLELALAPRLPGWLFTEAPTTRAYHDRVSGWTQLRIPAGAFAFRFMNRALVVYHNAARRPTYGRRGVAPARYRLTYRDRRVVEVAGATVPEPHASAVRDGEVARIDVTLA